MNTKYEELIPSHEKTILKLVQENVDKLSQHKKLVDDYAKLVKEWSWHVSTILTEVNALGTKQQAFMNSFQTSFNENVSNMNEVILSFQTSLLKEKEALFELHFRLQKDNVDHHTYIANSILTLQISKAHEKNGCF